MISINQSLASWVDLTEKERVIGRRTLAFWKTNDLIFNAEKVLRADNLQSRQ